jgi:hypothetical protein
MRGIDDERRSTGFRCPSMASCSALSSASTSLSSLRATRLRRSSRMREVASMPTSAVIRRVSSSSRISASILRPGSSSAMSVVSQAGAGFNLARRRLKKPRTPGFVGFVRHAKLSRAYDAGRAEFSAYDGRGARAKTRPGICRRRPPPRRPSKPARRKAQSVRIIGGAGAAGACISRSAGTAADAGSRARDAVQLAAAWTSRARAAWTCSPGPARSARRRCRAGARRGVRRAGPGGAHAARRTGPPGRHGARAVVEMGARAFCARRGEPST